MTANSERHLEVFVTARKHRSETTDVTFSVACELSKPMGKTIFPAPLKIELRLIGKKKFSSTSGQTSLIQRLGHRCITLTQLCQSLNQAMVIFEQLSF